MIISASSLCLVLLGTLYCAEAAPVPAQGDLENFVKAAKYLYDGLSQAMYEEAQAQFFKAPCSNINYANHVPVNGNNNFNFNGQVHLQGSEPCVDNINRDDGVSNGNDNFNFPELVFLQRNKK